MNKLLLIFLFCLLLPSCFGASVSGYGIFKIDPGVRIYKSADTILVHITHKEGEPQPNYRDISLFLKGVFP